MRKKNDGEVTQRPRTQEERKAKRGETDGGNEDVKKMIIKE